MYVLFLMLLLLLLFLSLLLLLLSLLFVLRLFLVLLLLCFVLLLCVVSLPANPQTNTHPNNQKQTKCQKIRQVTEDITPVIWQLYFTPWAPFCFLLAAQPRPPNPLFHCWG